MSGRSPKGVETSGSGLPTRSVAGMIAQARYSFISVVTVLATLAAWAISTNIGLISPHQIPSPQTMARSFLAFFASGYEGVPWYDEVARSIMRVAVGFACGVLLGVPTGLLMGISRIAEAAFMPFVAFMRPIPMIAFVPIVILFFGIGEASKILLIFASVYFYTTLNTAAGVASVPRVLLLAGRNIGFSGVRFYLRILVPAALPTIMNGIRLAAAVAWLLVVAAEMVAAQAGLGYMILDASTFFRIPYIYVGIFLIGIIGFLIDSVLSAVQRHVVHWEGR